MKGRSEMTCIRRPGLAMLPLPTETGTRNAGEVTPKRGVRGDLQCHGEEKERYKSGPSECHSGTSWQTNKVQYSVQTGLSISPHSSRVRSSHSRSSLVSTGVNNKKKLLSVRCYYYPMSRYPVDPEKPSVSVSHDSPRYERYGTGHRYLPGLPFLSLACPE